MKEKRRRQCYEKIDQNIKGQYEYVLLLLLCRLYQYGLFFVCIVYLSKAVNRQVSCI